MPFENLNIRAEEIDEILGKTPNSIIRWGVTVLFSIIMALLIGSWFFKYPDFINSTIEITTESPPADILAKANGKIEMLFVQNSEPVSEGKVLAIIENPANYQDILTLTGIIDSLKAQIINQANLSVFTDFPTADLNIGELQTYFSNLISSYNKYMDYLSLGYYEKKVEALEQEIINYRIYYKSAFAQQLTLEKDLDLAEKELTRYKSLFESQTIPESELEQAQSRFLNKKYAVESIRSTLANINIQISQLESNKIDLQLQNQQEKESLLILLNESFKNMAAQMDIWEKQYVLKAPIGGVCAFTKYWSQNQNVVFGEKVMTIIPEKEGRIVGKLLLPVAGAGKVKVGQQVNIRLSNFPYMEFGMLEGVIQNISPIPSDDNYYVEVNFPDGTLTSYGVEIPFSQNMSGSAEIITEDIRLLTRLFQPIRSLINEQKSYKSQK